MGNLILDIRYGARALLRSKAFAITVILTLAVCIGANSATFAIVSSVLLRPLPVPAADQILLMANRYPNAGAANLMESAPGDYYDRLEAMPAYQEQAMFDFGSETLDIDGAPERIEVMLATPSLSRLLQVPPTLGRAFSDDEGEIGAEQKVILSHGLWQQLYAGDPNVLGRDLRISGRPHTIVGVMPRGFVFVNPEIRLWKPLAFTPEQKQGRHNNNWYSIGRLKPGATLAQAQTQVDALNAANLERFPEWKELLVNAGFHTRVMPLQEMIVGEVRGILYLLWGGAVFVLLIGALNIANLALVRLTLRRKELATRMALGAQRIQILRQFVVENVLLTLIGGVAGVAVGAGLLKALATYGLERLPRANEIHVDGTVVLVALSMAAVVGLLVGCLPLAQSWRVNLSGLLNAEGRGGAGGRTTSRVRQSLVVAQIGIAFVLLVGAGLLLVSFRQLLRVDPGFNSEGVLTASTRLPEARYSGGAEVRGFVNRSLDAIRRTPGITSASITSNIPFSGSQNANVILAEGYVMEPGESLIAPNQIVVAPGYFETMGIELVSGRYFESRDDENAPLVVIVDERLANKFWPGQSPLGRRMHRGGGGGDLLKTDENTRWLTVVGVVRSIRLENLDGSGSPVGAYYFSHPQEPWRGFTFAIKTEGDPSRLAAPVRAAITSVDPELALFNVQTMAERSELSLSSRRTALLLAGGFGVVALFLSALGIYGVLAYQVTQRRREIGIRVALGSTAAGIVKLVVREGLLLAAAGLAVGFGGAIALRQVVENEIYGVGAMDPLVVGGVGLLLGAVVLAASVFPARRAIRVQPIRVLSQQ
jgi:predicted permease